MFSSGFLNVVAMSLVLGATSYGVGLAPLSMPLSKNQLSVLSDLGTGLLIGTALGVILPEGFEQTVTGRDSLEQSSYSSTVGIPILMGFALMFLLEEYATSHGRPQAAPPEGPSFNNVDLEELGGPERPPQRQAEASGNRRAYPLTFGLIIHALVDGYALGVSASNAQSFNLSLIVFLTIIVHKGPTALSLTTALLANSFSVMDCKKHLMYFSLATPVSSVLSYSLYAFHSENRSAWLGNALLFSGGTFLYVASVVHPMSGQALELPGNKDRKMVRNMLLVGGMFFPVLVSRFVVHEHH